VINLVRRRRELLRDAHFIKRETPRLWKRSTICARSDPDGASAPPGIFTCLIRIGGCTGKAKSGNASACAFAAGRAMATMQRKSALAPSHGGEIGL
jgi:hypothetical protein